MSTSSFARLGLTSGGHSISNGADCHLSYFSDSLIRNYTRVSLSLEAKAVLLRWESLILWILRLLSFSNIFSVFSAFSWLNLDAIAGLPRYRG